MSAKVKIEACVHFLAAHFVTQHGNSSADKLQQVRVNFSSNELFHFHLLSDFYVPDTALTLSGIRDDERHHSAL